MDERSVTPEFRPSTPGNIVEINEPDESTELTIVQFTFQKDEDQKKHIDKAIRTLYDVMNSDTSRASDKIGAAKLILEASGALGKGNTTNYITAENAQINNADNTQADKTLIMEALKGLKHLSGSSAADITVQKGGRGA